VLATGAARLTDLRVLVLRRDEEVVERFERAIVFSLPLRAVVVDLLYFTNLDLSTTFLLLLLRFLLGFH